MLDQADIALLSIVAVILLTGQWRTVRGWRQQRTKALKYKLYAVRDELIYLVASGALKESDPIFQFFYKACNVLIQETERITLRNIVTALRESQKRGLDPSSDRRISPLVRELHGKGSEVQRAVIGFYSAVLDILTAKSVLLRTLRYVDDERAKAARRVASHVHVPKTQRQAYLFYRDYTLGAHRFAAAT